MWRTNIFFFDDEFADRKVGHSCTSSLIFVVCPFTSFLPRDYSQFPVHLFPRARASRIPARKPVLFLFYFVFNIQILIEWCLCLNVAPAYGGWRVGGMSGFRWPIFFKYFFYLESIPFGGIFSAKWRLGSLNFLHCQCKSIRSFFGNR